MSFSPFLLLSFPDNAILSLLLSFSTNVIFSTLLSFSTHVVLPLLLSSYLPVAEMSIKPVSSRAGDFSGTRHRYEVCNMRFSFATDEDGMFNGSDEAVSETIELLGESQTK